MGHYYDNAAVSQHGRAVYALTHATSHKLFDVIAAKPKRNVFTWIFTSIHLSQQAIGLLFLNRAVTELISESPMYKRSTHNAYNMYTKQW